LIDDYFVSTAFVENRLLSGILALSAGSDFLLELRFFYSKVLVH